MERFELLMTPSKVTKFFGNVLSSQKQRLALKSSAYQIWGTLVSPSAMKEYKAMVLLI
jgi:hypothetical protein